MYLKGAKFLAVEIDAELDVDISRGFVGSVFARSVLKEDLIHVIQSLPHHGPALIGGSLSRIIWPMGRSIWERRRT